ncbi:TadE/TadG family type IV pilus assembly protein [Ramlibacter sp. WS9]|uniref:TadE/TadG family type IV pilus assembly protein n=1 Tax=Ramlibacter sp. WS9 TaxID=1882741 RepID=UPI0011422766|nr:TadE/TadG family type IV pilus assembly protein [Ramlibacter sp. WS9]ROZ76634.1 pilus assembly protein [Ramlibacter sp. WS9]
MRTKNRQAGVALLEFALILPFLLLLSIAAIELGRAVWQYNALTKSVRDAARYLSLQTPGTKMTQARNLAVYGNLSGTGTPLAPGLSTSHVPNPTWQTAGSAPVINTVRVTISGYTFTPMLANAFGMPFGTLTYSDVSATMRSYL